MGRWAQRKRTGGGPPAGVELVEMIGAFQSDPTDLQVTYSAAVTAAAFAPDDFQSFPSTEQSNSYGQVNPDEITITFSGDISGDNQVVYAGTVPGILTPQTLFF